MIVILDCLYFSNSFRLLWTGHCFTESGKYPSDSLFDSHLLFGLLICSLILKFYIPLRSSIPYTFPFNPDCCKESVFILGVVISNLTYLIPVFWLGCWFASQFSSFAVFNYIVALFNCIVAVLNCFYLSNLSRL